MCFVRARPHWTGSLNKNVTTHESEHTRQSSIVTRKGDEHNSFLLYFAGVAYPGFFEIAILRTKQICWQPPTFPAADISVASISIAVEHPRIAPIRKNHRTALIFTQCKNDLLYAAKLYVEKIDRTAKRSSTTHFSRTFSFEWVPAVTSFQVASADGTLWKTKKI